MFQLARHVMKCPFPWKLLDLRGECRLYHAVNSLVIMDREGESERRTKDDTFFFLLAWATGITGFGAVWNNIKCLILAVLPWNACWPYRQRYQEGIWICMWCSKDSGWKYKCGNSVWYWMCVCVCVLEDVGEMRNKGQKKGILLEVPFSVRKYR